MPAQSLPEVKNIASAIEAMLTAAHQALGGKPVIPRAAGENTEDIWVVPFFQRGPHGDHLVKRPDGNWDYDLYENCLLGFDLTVPRVNPLSPAQVVATYDLFAQEVLRIDLALDPARYAANHALLPYHHYTRLRGLGVSMGYDADRAEDRAEIRYKCFVGILPDAWPTAAAAYTNPLGDQSS